MYMYGDVQYVIYITPFFLQSVGDFTDFCTELGLLQNLGCISM